jgi:hypothetical protein
MSMLTLDELRKELEPINSKLDALPAMRAQLDGMPLLQRSTTTAHQDIRALRSAFNDFARENPTKGEIGTLHHDVNKVEEENVELARKVATLERLIAGSD